MDIKKVLDDAQRHAELIVGVVKLTNGVEFERGGRDKKTLMESRHTLALFRGIVRNKVVSELSAHHCRTFFDAVVH